MGSADGLFFKKTKKLIIYTEVRNYIYQENNQNSMQDMVQYEQNINKTQLTPKANQNKHKPTNHTILTIRD